MIEDRLNDYFLRSRELLKEMKSLTWNEFLPKLKDLYTLIPIDISLNDILFERRYNEYYKNDINWNQMGPHERRIFKIPVTEIKSEDVDKLMEDLVKKFKIGE
jgi:hypothetical protein